MITKFKKSYLPYKSVEALSLIIYNSSGFKVMAAILDFTAIHQILQN